MKNRIISISLAVVLALSVGLLGCGGEEVPEITEYTLTISSTDGGTTVPKLDCVCSEGTELSIEGIPYPDYRFVNWTGDVSTIANINAASTTITMNGDYSITASFVAVYHLTVSSTAGGAVTVPGEGAFTYDEGTLIAIVAQHDEGYCFVSWTGNPIDGVEDAETTITMQGDYSITANFEEEEVVTFPDPNLEAAIREAINVRERPIYPSDLKALTSLNAYGMNIFDLTGLEHCTSLTYLSLPGNQISDVSPLANLTGLTWLCIGDNHISDIWSLAGLTQLTWFDFSGNQISDISLLANLTNLTALGLSGYQIDEISDLVDLTKLTWLELSDDQISDISALAELTRLTGLCIRNNQITDISPLANLTNLTDLHLQSNQITDISPLANLTNLTGLGLSGHQIDEISGLVDLTKFTWLELPDSQISDVSPLAELTRLTRLCIWNNQIGDISPLANLTNLTMLWLSDNQISNISPLANLTSLAILWLEDNQISDISPLVENAGLSEGDWVALEQNPLSSDSINIYIPQLEARGVNVDY